MSTFMSTLKSVLNGEARIPGFEDWTFIPVKPDDSSMPGPKVSLDALRKICVLQSLAIKASETGEFVPTYVLSAGLEEMGGSKSEMTARSIAVTEDAAYRVMFLEYLIVEVVRDEVPAECERMGVRYFVTGDNRLMFRPLPATIPFMG